ncbi:hypothetical protein [Anaeromyxobacter oryzae]|uniref:Uncharacterized protein n=1 Tax=Anaeromyxobacter oryzae TaxID=2918170 RepID=A0ABN6MZ36_9BACT|nr:hypothetical protein [Anaeromyxobacter oryzae]BDG04828.1 hypothetical protein AMOR_38240 [Anaeromyxobacter oryzae]
MPFRVTRPYAPRPVAYRGVVEHLGYRLKRYSIWLPGETFAEARFRAGRGLALSAVPEPAVTAERPGVGFLVEHQGRDMDFVVVAWWDRENELPVRIIVCDEHGGWRPARDESFCVWDLQVIAAERDAYVETVLTPGGGGVEGYLGRSWAGT